MKIVTIIEDNVITGVKYGVIEVPDTDITKALDNYGKAQKTVGKVRKAQYDRKR